MSETTNKTTDKMPNGAAPNNSAPQTPDFAKLFNVKPAVPWTLEDPISLLVFAKEGTGKTGLGFTFPAPVVGFFTEQNYKETLANPVFADKQVFVGGEYMIQPVENRSACKAEVERFLMDYYAKLNAAKASKIRATMMLDSGSAFWDIIRFGLVETMTPDGKVRTAWDYAKANNTLEKLFKDTAKAGCNMVVTARGKNIWVKTEKGAEKTEAIEADIKDIALYESSVIVEMALASRLNQQGQLVPARVSTIKKCQPAGKLIGFKKEDLTYNDLVQLIQVYNTRKPE